jgi:hypothetical protein
MPILDARLLDSDPEGAELLRAILKTKRGRKAEDGFSVDANFSTATDGFPKVSRNAGVSKAVRNRGDPRTSLKSVVVDGHTQPRDVTYKPQAARTLDTR